MRIDFLGLQAFLSVAERGSFQRAAAHLNLSQTAVSHRMRKLEDELGLKLFARTTREVTLTRAGIELLPKAQKALAELEQSFDELKQQGALRRDRLNIACLPALAVHHLPPLLRRFHVQFPEVEVRIVETPSAAVALLVQSGEVELGLGVALTNRWDLEIEIIAEAPLALACPSSHPLARKRAINWVELEGQPMIRVGSKTAIRPMIDDTLGAARIALGWRYEVEHVETAVSLVEAGLGLAVVPSLDVELHRGAGLIAVPLRNPKVSCSYGLVTRRGIPLSPTADALRRLLVEAFQSKPAKAASSS